MYLVQAKTVNTYVKKKEKNPSIGVLPLTFKATKKKKKKKKKMQKIIK